MPNSCKYSLFVILITFWAISIQSQQHDCHIEIPYDSDSNYSSTYYETMSYWHRLAQCHPSVSINVVGTTDIGKPLHLVVIEQEPLSEDDGKINILINNAIHPGEPCGVEASMIWVRQLLSKPNDLLDHARILIVPTYNVGGMLNRNSHSRANQDGPKAYGFRGNAKNLDLNRDFIKMDSKNMFGLASVFKKYDPDVFIDTHTTNGADFPYKMSLISNQIDMLSPIMSGVMSDVLLPSLFDGMKQRNDEMIPYLLVNPNKGVQGGTAAMLDHPRFSMGYAALRNTFGFTTEAHMLKTFSERVTSTVNILDEIILNSIKQKAKIQEARAESKAYFSKASTLALQWEVDTTKVSDLPFHGYKAKKKKSEISGLDRIYYDHEDTFDGSIDYVNRYKPSLTVRKPNYYIVPQAYSDIMDRLKANGVAYKRLRHDTTIFVELYRILDFKTRPKAYEAHFMHSQVEVAHEEEIREFYRGDYVISTNQEMGRLIVLTLEPQGADSYFAWNFFDGVLMQKEYFSPYLFEDRALEVLEKNEGLKRAFESKQATDSTFAKSAYAQLTFIYQNSAHYEHTHKLYPVARSID